MFPLIDPIHPDETERSTVIYPLTWRHSFLWMTTVFIKGRKQTLAGVEKAMELIRKYDFRPNVFAKGLKNTRSGVIGLLTALVDSFFYGQLVAECMQARKYMDMFF